jgi:hypothetical protein
LVFAFVPAEKVDQYNAIFTAFSPYGIDLSTFILESDQGSSLTLFAKTHNITQRFGLGARRPTLLDMELDIETKRKERDPSGELRLSNEKVAARPLDTRGPKMVALQKLTEEHIRHFSHTRRKKQELHDWGVNNFPQDSGGGYVLGLPISVIRFIHGGVAIFSH